MLERMELKPRPPPKRPAVASVIESPNVNKASSEHKTRLRIVKSLSKCKINAIITRDHNIAMNIHMIKANLIGIAILLCTTTSLAANHHPQEFLKKITGSKTEGKQIVQHYCAMCHAENPMIQLGAPVSGQKNAWESRIKQGIDMLFKHTDEGFNAMPARGGCFECTDKQLMLAIMALLPQEIRPKINQ